MLRARIDAGASVRAIAAELNVTELPVRNRLHRLGTPLPSVVKAARIDLNVVFAAYRSGEPVVRIAKRHGVSSRWVTDCVLAHGVKRDVPMQPKVRLPRYPEPTDRLRLLERPAKSRSVYRVAHPRAATDRRGRLRRPMASRGRPPTPIPSTGSCRSTTTRSVPGRRTRMVDEATALARRARAVTDTSVSRGAIRKRRVDGPAPRSRGAR